MDLYAAKNIIGQWFPHIYTNSMKQNNFSAAYVSSTNRTGYIPGTPPNPTQPFASTSSNLNHNSSLPTYPAPSYEQNRCIPPRLPGPFSEYSLAYNQSIARGAVAAEAALTALRSTPKLKTKGSSEANESPKALGRDPHNRSPGNELINHANNYKKGPNHYYKASDPRVHHYPKFVHRDQAFAPLIGHHKTVYPKRYGYEEPSISPIIKIKLESPEEIQEWIAERKKNYPTDANIEKKRKAEEARIARGEVISKSDNRLNKRPRDYHRKDRSGYFGKKLKFNQHDNLSTLNTSPTDILAAAEAAAPISTESLMRTELARNMTLDKTKVEENSSPSISRTKYKKICRYFRTGDCFRGDACSYSHRLTVKSTNPDYQQSSPNMNLPVPRSGNLLKMLLDKDIKKERNILLQSLRYIVDNNFFNIVSNDSLEAARRRGGPNIVDLNTETKELVSNNADLESESKEGGDKNTPAIDRQSGALIKSWLVDPCYDSDLSE
ncbi:hypothetical protein G9A89_019957 [Geosiphon pyriformis]|nr:hypothetical protein G9A89_019957 [Geosiphon pyriformis]